MNGRVLIVAGSDSGGGAGIQADIKTVTALGGFAATAVTALTVQNTQGVFGVLPVPPDFLRHQMTAVLEDIGADAIKIGMLHDVPVIEAVAEVLRAHCAGIPVVLDPVMVAQSGASLLAEAAVDRLRRELFPLASVVTPNLPEAEKLLGRGIASVEEMQAAARDLVALGAPAALLKGGHLEGDVITDILATAGGEELFTGKRLPGRSRHGTGCTLASAIATGLAQHLTLRESVQRARAYLRRAIATAPALGQGDGPVNHAHTVAAFDGIGD
jgi:hydroxymethylpyrimidine/phosphomethylpyrimidine kinase